MRHFISPLALIGAPPEMEGFDPDEAVGVEIEHGCRIEAFVTVDAGCQFPTHVAKGAWLMKKVHLGHDVHVGEDCRLAPGAVIGGYATIARKVHIGMNATVLPYIYVAEGAIIGAGAVVTKHVPTGEIWAGNPSQQLNGWQNIKARLRCGCSSSEISIECVIHGPMRDRRRSL